MLKNLLPIFILLLVVQQNTQDDSLKIQAISRFVDSTTQSDTILKTSPKIEVIDIKTERYESIKPDDPQYAKYGQYRVRAYRAWINGDYKKVIEELSQIENKSDLDLKFLTKAYIKEKKWNLALNTGNDLISVDSLEIKDIKDINGAITLLLSLGTVALVNKKYDMAIDYFNKIIQKLDPKCYQAYEHLGYTYYLENQYDNAIKNWKKAIRGCKNPPLLYYLIGIAYFKLENLEQAKAYFEKIMPDNEWYLYSVYYLSHMAYKNKNYSHAKEILDKIWIRSATFSPVEFDIIKKKIYCNYILGLTNLERNPRVALQYFKDAVTIIDTYHLTVPKYTYIAIIRGILKRLIDDVNGDGYQLSNAYFQNIIDRLKECYREGTVTADEIKTLGNVIYLSSNSEWDRKIAAKSFKIIKDVDKVAKNNFYCLIGSTEYISSNLINQLPGTYNLFTFYFLYNLTNLYFHDEKIDESLRLSDLFRKCAERIPGAKFRNELLAKHLRNRMLMNENKYANQPERLRIINDALENEIENLYQQKLKNVPEFIFLDEKQYISDLLILYTM